MSIAARSSAAAASAPAMSPAKQALWFTISGWIGTAIFYVVYEWIHALGNRPESDGSASDSASSSSSRPMLGLAVIDALEWSTVAWTSSYALSILWQHALHRYLVFGSQSPYLSSLLWTYLSYALSIVLSAVVQHALLAWLGLHHRLAFGLTLVITGVVNFHTVKGAFQAPDQTSAKDQKTHAQPHVE